MKAPLLETIRVQDGKYITPEVHLARMRASSLELTGAPVDMASLPPVPLAMRQGTVKCRILYGERVERVEFNPYMAAGVSRLRIVEAPFPIDYHLKYADRTLLERLREMRGDASDVIIAAGGYIADTSYSNILLLAPDATYTPAHPLLEGTMRKKILEDGDIRPIDITPAELMSGKYGIHSVALINAMLPPGAIPPVPLFRISIKRLFKK